MNNNDLDLPAVQEAGFYDAGELLATYKILKLRHEEQCRMYRDLLESRIQQAEAWEAIFALLQKIEPGWLDKAGCAQDAALVTIREAIEEQTELKDVLEWITKDYISLNTMGLKGPLSANWRQRVARAEAALGYRL